MNFNEYQDWAKTTDVFTQPKINHVDDPSFITKVLGLSGEAGEVSEKFKKILRDKNGIINEDDKAEIVKELGDVLWYVAIIARYMDVPLEKVVEQNVAKLSARLANNKLHGSGDNR